MKQLKLYFETEELCKFLYNDEMWAYIWMCRNDLFSVQMKSKEKDIYLNGFTRKNPGYLSTQLQCNVVDKLYLLAKNLGKVDHIFFVTEETIDKIYKPRFCYDGDREDYEDYKDFVAMGVYVEHTPAIPNVFAAKKCDCCLNLRGEFIQTDSKSYGKYLDCNKAIFICPKRIERTAKTLNVSFSQLLQVVITHEMGHAAFSSVPKRSVKFGERQANWFSSFVNMCDLDGIITELSKKQPSEYHNPLVASSYLAADYKTKVEDLFK